MLSCNRKEFRESEFFKIISYLLTQHTLNRYVSFIVFFSFELDFSIGESKKSVVFSKANIETRIMFSSSLANYDVTCFGYLAAEEFHPQSFSLRNATVK